MAENDNNSGQVTETENMEVSISPDLTLPDNPVPTSSPAEATSSPVSIEDLLLQLNSGAELSSDTIDQIIKAGEERKKKIVAQQQSQLEDKFKVQTEPHEVKIKELQLKIEEIEARGNKNLEELRQKIRDAKELVHAQIVEYIRDTYNPFRASIGLAPRNLRGGNRGPRQSSGKRNSYDLEWVGDSATSDTIKIIVKGLPNDSQYEGTVKVEGNSVSIKSVERVLTDAGVELRTGGNARGIVNRLRSMISERSGNKPEPLS